MKLILNIGLNVGNEEPTRQLTNTLLLLSNKFIVRNTKIVEGINERTLVVEIYLPVYVPHDTQKTLEEISYELEQKYITYTINNTVGNIAYHPHYIGEKMRFIKKYFKNI